MCALRRRIGFDVSSCSWSTARVSSLFIIGLVRLACRVAPHCSRNLAVHMRCAASGQWSGRGVLLQRNGTLFAGLEPIEISILMVYNLSNRTGLEKREAGASPPRRGGAPALGDMPQNDTERHR